MNTTTSANNQLASIDPLTGEIVGQVSITSAEALSMMVERAHQAQTAWGVKNISERSYIVRKAYEKLMEVEEELSELISR